MKTLMRLEPKLFLKVKACILATKGKMINSMLIANDFINALPKKETPETTKGYEGFFHTSLNWQQETVLELIIRDHSKLKFEKRKN
jgi:tripeptide aminopeptidase